MKTDFDKFVDAFIEHAMKATGMTREELLKGWSADGKVAQPAPVIEVGDVVTGCTHSTGSHECTVIGMANKGRTCALQNTLNPCCACFEDKDGKLIGIKDFTLIRKGPKVIEITEPLINREHFVSVPKLISCDMPYGDYHITLTLTEEVAP